MARHIAYLSSRAFAVAALLALAILLRAGPADAHERASHDLPAGQETVFAADAIHCPAAAIDCGHETGGPCMPCSGMTGGHCSQAGASLVPFAFAAPVAPAGTGRPRADEPGSGIFAAVDTPPPRA